MRLQFLLLFPSSAAGSAVLLDCLIRHRNFARVVPAFQNGPLPKKGSRGVFTQTAQYAAPLIKPPPWPLLLGRLGAQTQAYRAPARCSGMASACPILAI